MTVPMLRSLTLKNFRSIRATKIDFDNPTFLVGQNGAGKSNIADAFAFLAEAMTSPLSAVLDRRGGLNSVGYRGATTGRRGNLGVHMELADLDDETCAATYAFELRAIKPRSHEIVREQCTVTKIGNSRHWFERRLRRPIESSIGPLTPSIDAASLALPLIGGDERFRPVAAFLSEMQRYLIEPSVLREIQDPDEGVRLSTNGGNAASVLREIRKNSPDNWEEIKEFLELIVPHTIGVEPRQVGNKLELEFTQEGAGSRKVRFKAYNMSDGTLRTLGILAAIFQRSRPFVLVLEEPEATVHVGALGAILDLLHHASSFGQVVVTTHSPDILDAEWIEDRHLKIVSWNEGRTDATPLSDASRAALQNHLMRAGEQLRSNALTGAPVPDLFVSKPAQVPLWEKSLR